MEIPNKKISIITVAYKSNTFLRRLLDSIQRWNDIEDKIETIVVDNYPFGNEAFGSICAIYPWVKLINNPDNGGFGQGNNIGVKFSVGEYLLFLNPDTELIEPIFKFTIQKFNQDRFLGAFGLTLCDSAGKKNQPSYGIFPEIDSISRRVWTYCSINFFKFTPWGVFPWGADIFIRRRLFEEVGGFDDKYFLCFEEPDLIRRIPDFYKIKIFSKKIHHGVGHSLKAEGLLKKIEWHSKSEKYYFEKYCLSYNKFLNSWILKLKIIIFIKKMLLRDVKDTKLVLTHYEEIQKSS